MLDVPEVMVIHPALLDAVQAHVDPALTATEPVPPDAAADALVGLIEYVHAGAGVTAACVTVKVRPAIVNVPVRAAPVLAATVKAVDPLPLPAAPEVTVIQGTLLAAVHAHPAAAVTVTGVPVPPGAAMCWLVASSAKVQVDVGDADPAWLTVNVRPAIAAVPERPLVLLFAATLYDTAPLPLPLALEVIVIHVSPLVAVHAHPAWLAMLIVPLVPLTGTESVVGEISN